MELVCYAAVFSFHHAMLLAGEVRCVTTLKTQVVKQTKIVRLPMIFCALL